ncbi:hypothetical protein [Absidia glauca]|uniref:Chromo domain-containing protein n=1 Tax=Absidia glauca TaxID=4829 RepID=A0A168T5E7_ABSGL|nr:hypothetical protein [Absidia glauca]
MSLDDSEDEIFEVEKILDHTFTTDGKRLYYIKWRNYESEHNTWEPEENLFCPLMKDAYHEQRDKADAATAAKGQTSKCRKTRGNSGAPRKTRQKQPKSTTITPPLRHTPPVQSLSPSQPPRPVLMVKLSLPKPLATEPSIPPAKKTPPLQFPIPSKRPILTVKLSLPKPTTQPTLPALTSTLAPVAIPPKPQVPTQIDVSAPTQPIVEPAKSSMSQRGAKVNDPDGSSTHPPANLNIVGPIKYPTGSRSSNTLKRQRRDSSGTTSPVYAKDFDHRTNTSPPRIRKTRFDVLPLSPTQPTKAYVDTSSRRSSVLSTDLSPSPPSFINASDLIATTVLPSRLIKHLFKDGDCCIMGVLPPDTHIPNWSKLHRFLQINEQAAVLRSPKQPDSALVLHPKNTAPDGPLCAMFIKNIVVPKSVPLPVVSKLTHAWQYVATILMFPESLCHLLHNANIQVFGSSALADLVRSAIRRPAKVTRTVFLVRKKKKKKRGGRGCWADL